MEVRSKAGSEATESRVCFGLKGISMMLPLLLLCRIAAQLCE